jgi:DNA adenine methylase
MPVATNPTPIVKWVGGKRQLQNRILAEFANSSFDAAKNTYFEPFFGGGAILFALQPQKAVINDVNSKLVNLYRQVQSNLSELTREARKIESQYNSLAPDLDAQLQFFLEKRKAFNSGQPNNPEHAALFLFLNKAGFNGMYRENARGDYNIPFGKRAALNLLDDGNLSSVSDLLKEVKILNDDFSKAVEKTAKAGDLVYFDPPYVPLTVTAAFTGYTKEGFDPEMQQNLARVAKQLTERGVNVAISNSSHETVRELYGTDFESFPLMATRMLAAKTSSRAQVTELLFTNFRKLQNG